MRVEDHADGCSNGVSYGHVAVGERRAHVGHVDLPHNVARAGGLQLAGGDHVDRLRHVSAEEHLEEHIYGYDRYQDGDEDERVGSGSDSDSR